MKTQSNPTTQAAYPQNQELSYREMDSLIPAQSNQPLQSLNGAAGSPADPTTLESGGSTRACETLVGFVLAGAAVAAAFLIHSGMSNQMAQNFTAEKVIATLELSAQSPRQ